MNKEAARIFAKSNVKALPTQARQVFDEQIFERVVNSSVYKNCKSIFIYRSLKSEVSTVKLIKKALEDKKAVYCPVTREKEMFAVPVTIETKYVKGALKISEPVGEPFSGKIDLVIVPLTAYDDKLNRVGKGGGYYDRYLKNRKSIKLGIAYSCQCVNNVSAEEYDVPLDMLINEKETICG